MRLLIVLKFILILGLFVAGILFLLKGLGVATPLLAYKGAEAHDVPAGILLVIIGVGLASFWKIRSSQVVIKQTTTRQKNGESQTSKRETRTGSQFVPDPNASGQRDKRI